MNAGAIHVIGAGIAGLSAATRLVEIGRNVIVHEAASFAGGRCRSYHDPTLGFVIDNGNHLLLSGNRQALDYLDRIGARDTLHDPGAAIFEFADLKSGERWRLDLGEGRIPWWLFDRKKRVPGTAFSEYFAPLGVFVKGRGATVGEAMACKGPLYERLWRPLLTSALNTDPPESSALLTAALLRETLAAGGKACHPLFAGHGLANSFVDPAVAFLAARGSAVRFGDRLRAISFEGERAVALDFDGGPSDAWRGRFRSRQRAAVGREEPSPGRHRRRTNFAAFSMSISRSRRLAATRRFSAPSMDRSNGCSLFRIGSQSRSATPTGLSTVRARSSRPKSGARRRC